MDISDPLLPPIPIIHYFWQVSHATFSICTELLYVRAGHPAFACPCEGVHRSTSLTSLSLLLQQCPACLVHLILIVFVTGGRWLFCGVLSPGLVQYCLQHSCIIAVKFFSPYILLASTWCIHIAVSILLPLGRNCTSFYRSGMTSIWPIAYP